MKIRLPAIVNGVLITLPQVGLVLDVFMTEPVAGTHDDVVALCVTKTRLPMRTVEAILKWAIDEGAIDLQVLPSLDRHVQPHLLSEGHCGRCDVPWPCASVVQGRDAPPAVASAGDWAPLAGVARARAELSMLGLIADLGKRRATTTGDVQIVWGPTDAGREATK